MVSTHPSPLPVTSVAPALRTVESQACVCVWVLLLRVSVRSFARGSLQIWYRFLTEMFFTKSKSKFSSNFNGWTACATSNPKCRVCLPTTGTRTWPRCQRRLSAYARARLRSARLCSTSSSVSGGKTKSGFRVLSLRHWVTLQSELCGIVYMTFRWALNAGCFYGCSQLSISWPVRLWCIFAFVASCGMVAAQTCVNIPMSSTCKWCTPGWFQRQYQQPCCQCSPGTYTDQCTGSFSLSTCTSCPQGTFTPNYASTSCTPCLPGSYGRPNGASRASCAICQAGTYNPLTGSSSSSACIPCDAGTSNPSAGSSSVSACAPCPEGTASVSIGSSACTPCQAGSYNPATKSVSCILCQAGTYNPLNGSSSASACTPCQAGTFSPSAGSSSCTPCPTGAFSSVNGSLGCAPCQPGTFGPSLGSSSCSSCRAGTFNPLSGSSLLSACISCGLGTYSDAGQASCSDCLAGYYCPDPAQKPQKCPTGSYCPAKSSAPDMCQSGFLCAQEGLAQQTPCPSGHYCPSSDQSVPCPAGTFSSSSGQISDSTCRPCFPSQICPEGTSNPTSAQATTTTWQIVTYVLSAIGSLIGILVSVFKVYPAIKGRIAKLREAGIRPTIKRIIFLDKTLSKYRPLLDHVSTRDASLDHVSLRGTTAAAASAGFSVPEKSLPALLRLNASQIGTLVASIGSAYVDYRQLIVGNNLTGEYIAGKSESSLTSTLLDIGICKELHATSIVKIFMRLKSGDEATLAAAMSNSSC
jgi:hypothetical protein